MAVALLDMMSRSQQGQLGGASLMAVALQEVVSQSQQREMGGASLMAVDESGYEGVGAGFDVGAQAIKLASCWPVANVLSKAFRLPTTRSVIDQPVQDGISDGPSTLICVLFALQCLESIAAHS